MMKIAVTGAGGFVGRSLVRHCARLGWDAIAMTRRGHDVEGAYRNVATGDLEASIDAGLFEGLDCVVNCAARVHVMQAEDPAQAEIDYDRTNRALPVALAAAAREAGVARFVQISSVAALASATGRGETIDDDSSPRPATPYGRSKLAADHELARMCSDAFTTVSLRFPVVYGPDAGAWFGMLQRAARMGVPLPLGSIHNRRSFIFIENAVSAIARAAQSTRTGVYIVTDGEPMSSAQLYRVLCRSYGHAHGVFSVPSPLVELAARLVLRSRASSLLGDAGFDGSRFERDFAWRPPFTAAEGIAATVEA